jgi:hypothetical protein
MTQEILTEEQKANLKMLSAEFDTEYIKLKDGDERLLEFDPNFGKGKSEKFGTMQATFNVIDINNPFTPHKFSIGSKKAVHLIAEYLLKEQFRLRIKRIGDGTSTRWDINPI